MPRTSRGPLQVHEANVLEINDQLRQIRDELDSLHNATTTTTTTTTTLARPAFTDNNYPGDLV